MKFVKSTIIIITKYIMSFSGELLNVRIFEMEFTAFEVFKGRKNTGK